MNQLFHFGCLLLLFLPCSLFSITEEVLRGLTLKHAQQLALVHNQTVRKTDQEKEIATRRFRQSLGDWLPQATLQSQQAFQSSSPSSFAKRSSALSVQQPLFDLPRYYRLQIRHLEKQQMKIKEEEERERVCLQVLKFYYLTIVEKKKCDLAQEQLVILGEMLKQEEEKFEIGESTAFDVNRSKVELMGALSSYYENYKEWEKAQTNLLLTMGYPLSSSNKPLVIPAEEDIPLDNLTWLKDKIVQLESSSDHFTPFIDLFLQRIIQGQIPIEHHHQWFSDEELDAWQQLMEKHNFALLQQQYTCWIVNEKTKSAQSSAFMPTVDLSASYASKAHKKRFFHRPHRWEGAIQLTWNLFAGGKTVQESGIAENEKKRAKLEYEALFEQKKEQLLSYVLEVENAIVDYLTAKTGTQLAKQALDQAREKRALGLTTALEYREAAKSVLQEQLRWQNSRYRLLVSCHDLYFHLGLTQNDIASCPAFLH